MSNPYNNLTPLHTPEMFFGRAKLIQRIYAAIVRHQSLSLTGTQRIGKSSVLIHITRPEAQKLFESDLSHYLFVYIEIGEHLSKTRNDFFDDVSRSIAEAYRQKTGVELEMEKGEDGFRNILERIARVDFHPVLLMDAFDNVTRNKEFNPEFFSFLRAQATQGKVSYITASIDPLNKVCHDAILTSPFFNIFDIYKLEPLRADETWMLIMEPAAKANHPFTQSEGEWIIAQVGYHPFFLQRACYYMFEAKEEAKALGNKVDLERIKRKIVDYLYPQFKHMWKKFSEEDRERLTDEIRQPLKHSREIAELSDCPLFCAFLGPLSLQIREEDLEKALEKMSDLSTLGESVLKHLRLVAVHQPAQGGKLSAIDRGRAISKILNNALERIRGNGIRTDEAQDWKMYNILYYRYFKHHMHNKHIASRLGIGSIRTYYREWNKAISELLHTLYEMEMELDSTFV